MVMPIKKSTTISITETDVKSIYRCSRRVTDRPQHPSGAGSAQIQSFSILSFLSYPQYIYIYIYIYIYGYIYYFFSPHMLTCVLLGKACNLSAAPEMIWERKEYIFFPDEKWAVLGEFTVLHDCQLTADVTWLANIIQSVSCFGEHCNKRKK